MSKKKFNDLSNLIDRLDQLDSRLEVDPSKKKDAEDADLDEFTRTKKSCARMVAEIRKTIAERDDLLLQQGGGGSKKTIEMSAKVRNDIKQLKDTAELLGEMQRKDATKIDKKPLLNRKSSPNTVEEVEHRGEVVDLVWRHVEEVELLEKRRFQSPTSKKGASEDRAGLLSHSSKATHMMPMSATSTSLEDIDADTAAGLAMLKRKDEEIDQDLDLLSAGVKRLGAIATDMKAEISMQNVMIDEITNEVDKNVAHLQSLNAKLKDTLEKAGGVQRFIIHIILFVLVVAVVLYIVRMMLSN